MSPLLPPGELPQLSGDSTAPACELSLEGSISKRADAPYSPGDRGLWVKVKCQNREEFVVVGWTYDRRSPIFHLAVS